ncbi:MAG: TlyA family RNA methyltransferase [Firmicutes bacterium]|jgi:23S rRNA (cytidine1920-2'-O)/16S rRNA (cytidine1409-2'-O)-methyltransferase|nr:TlyA family RNA methyltransferase [Bacillota bacterium]
MPEGKFRTGGKKERLDVLLVGAGIASSREKARRIIMAGEIFVNGMPEIKPGTFVKPNSEIIFKPLKGEKAFVSRGGKKLDKAFQVFEISVENKVAMDIGASTGGFTDCLLRRGAKRVYAIDVGYGQLAWELQENPKVIVLDRTNIRYLSPDVIPEPVDFATVDVSFISVKKFMEHLLTFLKDDGELIVLIKPQFEAGRDKVQKGGVVSNARVHAVTIKAILEFMEGLGVEIRGLTYSPITGPAGNIEFLVYAVKNEAADLEFYSVQAISQVVQAAHRELGDALSMQGDSRK